MLDVVVLISGSGSNLLALLRRAASPQANFRVAAVFADRPAPGLQHAENYGVPAAVVDPKQYGDRDLWGAALAAQIRKFGVSAECGLVVSAGLMRILPAAFVIEFAPRLINTHPALLPNFPGAHAVRDALAAGVTQTGVTVHHIDEGVDTGQVIAQAVVPVNPDDTEEQLHERIKERERQLLPDVVSQIAGGLLQL